MLRLDWADVWRVKGKVEISARIAKGRKRRLVDICPALAAWLRPYRNVTGAGALPLGVILERGKPGEAGRLCWSGPIARAGDRDAFGLWGDHAVDGLAYQEQARGEW